MPEPTLSAIATRQKTAEAEGFLSRFRRCVTEGGFHFLKREEAIQGCIDLGLTPDVHREVRGILANLTSRHFVEGPVPDHDRPDHDVWIFGYEINGLTAYIKLRITRKKEGEKSAAAVWSFHLADWPLQFPLRKTAP